MIFHNNTVFIVYILISAVKISMLMQAITFSSLTVLNIFDAVNTGAELRLATPLTNAASVFFLDKDCVYLDVERLYDHIKQETFQTCTPLHLSSRRKSNEHGNGTGD